MYNVIFPINITAPLGFKAGISIFNVVKVPVTVITCLLLLLSMLHFYLFIILYCAMFIECSILCQSAYCFNFNFIAPLCLINIGMV